MMRLHQLATLFLVLATATFATPYFPTGVQTLVNIANVINGGWTLCHESEYHIEQQLGVIMGMCDEDFLLVACNVEGQSTLKALAWAERDKVYMSVPTDSSAHHLVGKC